MYHLCVIHKRFQSWSAHIGQSSDWAFYDDSQPMLIDQFILFYFIIYLFFYFTILYWFCHTSTCIHHGCTCVPNPEPPFPLPSPYHPSGSSQCTSPKLPVSCIEPGLGIHFLYDIIHVLVPFSQIIPPFPFPQSPKDCSIHLCLFCCLAYTNTVY